MILRRDSHIDDLALREEQVRRVVEPILTGADQQAWTTEDIAYVCDLGLVAQADGKPHIANPIYVEVVPRHLNYAVQAGLPQRMAWYVGADGGLDVAGLIAAFQECSASTPSTGCSASSDTMRPARSCCCRRTCSAS